MEVAHKLSNQLLFDHTLDVAYTEIHRNIKCLSFHIPLYMRVHFSYNFHWHYMLHCSLSMIYMLPIVLFEYRCTQLIVGHFPAALTSLTSTITGPIT
eukprot:UN09031